MSFKTRLFLILFFAGFAGIASFLLVDLAQIIALIPEPARADVPAITPAIKVLSLIQPAVVLSAAVLIGIVLAPRVGLSAPVAELLAAGGRRVFPVLRSQLVPGVLGGLVGALAILLTKAVFNPFFTTQTIERVSRFQSLVPIPTRLLSGGITEELLMRWGLMTLLVWTGWRVFQKRMRTPPKVWFVVAILLSSLVFGVGHLPVAVMLLRETAVAVILFVIIANSAFGVVAGYLYWKWGLESAILAHMFGHVVLALASYAGAYF